MSKPTMSWWRRSILSAVVVLVGILLALRLWIRFSGAPSRIIEQPEDSIYIADVFRRNIVGQSFRASHNNLCRVDLRLKPVLGECQVTFQLQSEDSESAVWEGDLPCPQDEAQWYTVRFPRIQSSEAQVFHWSVGLADPEAGAVVSLEATDEDVHPDGSLRVNARATAIDTVSAPYYCTPRVTAQMILRWVDRRRLQFLRWLDQEHEILNREQLLRLTGIVAICLVVLFILPSRERPLRLHLPRFLSLSRAGLTKSQRLAILLIGVMVGFSVLTLLIAFQMRLWTRTAARLHRSETEIAQPPEDVWVAYDFLAELADPETVVDAPENWYVEPGWVEIQAETVIDRRPALRMHPPSLVYYTVNLPPNARLHTAATMDPSVWDSSRGDGVLFIVRIIDEGLEETVYYQEIDPKNNLEDRRWHDFEIDLRPYAGRTVTFLFITYPMESNEWDWAAWGMPVILTPNPPHSLLEAP